MYLRFNVDDGPVRSPDAYRVCIASTLAGVWLLAGATGAVGSEVVFEDRPAYGSLSVWVRACETQENHSIPFTSDLPISYFLGVDSDCPAYTGPECPVAPTAETFGRAGVSRDSLGVVATSELTSGEGSDCPGSGAAEVVARLAVPFRVQGGTGSAFVALPVDLRGYISERGGGFWRLRVSRDEVLVGEDVTGTQVGLGSVVDTTATWTGELDYDVTYYLSIMLDAEILNHASESDSTTYQVVGPFRGVVRDLPPPPGPALSIDIGYEVDAVCPIELADCSMIHQVYDGIGPVDARIVLQEAAEQVDDLYVVAYSLRFDPSLDATFIADCADRATVVEREPGWLDIAEIWDTCPVPSERPSLVGILRFTATGPGRIDIGPPGFEGEATAPLILDCDRNRFRVPVTHSAFYGGADPGPDDPAPCELDPACESPLTRPTDVSGRTGDEVAVEILLDGNPDPVDAFGLDLGYDPTMLSFARVEPGDLTGDFVVVEGMEQWPGVLTVGGFGTTSVPVGSSGSLATVVFEVTCGGCAEGQESALTITSPVDDLQGLNLCRGTFSYRSCSLGDVTADEDITPEDALCAFDIYVHGGTPVSGSECDTECATIAADATCNGDVTPADGLTIFLAYLDGAVPPLDCAPAGRSSAEPTVLAIDEVSGAPSDAIGVAIRAEHPTDLDAFGLELTYPEDLLQFTGVRRADATQAWTVIDGRENDPGVVTIGGFTLSSVRVVDSDPLLWVDFLVRDEAAGSGPITAGAFRDDLDGATVEAGAFRSSGPGEPGSLPPVFGLEAIGASPFVGGTTIEYRLPRESYVELVVFDARGRVVRTLVSSIRIAGPHVAHWDGRNDAHAEVSPGVYFCRLRSDGREAVRKLMRSP